MKRMKKLLCIICAAILPVLCLTGCGSDRDIISDAEEVVSMVMDFAEDLADPDPPVLGTVPTAEPTPAVTAEPTQETEPAQQADKIPETPAGTQSAEPVPAGWGDTLRPGTYTDADGSVLKVSEDGTCTYDTVISGAINGEAMTGTVTFHGTVEDGKISFTKITYFGLDITALAAAAGYSDPAYWEAAAQSIYN